MALVPLLLICVGLALVVISADEAIKRVLNLAKHLRLSTFVMSFVIGGSIAILPELFIGVVSAFEGVSSLGFGVILGSNVADLTLVFGVVILFAGNLKVDPATLKHMRRSFLTIALPVLLFVDGEISRLDGIILVLFFILYMFMLFRTKRDEPDVSAKKGKNRFSIDVIVLVTSMAVLFVGGILITDNSQALSLLLGVPLFLIGVVVAVGTCLPEMTFAIRASVKKHGELGLGNILGNVLTDSMLTIGIVALIQPIQPRFTIMALSTGVFMAVSALAVYVLSRDGKLDRKDGLLLVILYGIFLAMQTVIEGSVT